MTIKNEMWLKAELFEALYPILHYKPSFLNLLP